MLPLREILLKGNKVEFLGAEFNSDIVKNYREILIVSDQQDICFKYDNHYKPYKNIVLHYRIFDKEKSYLHVEEIQSDWAFKGRINGFIHSDYYIKFNLLKKQLNDMRDKLIKKECSFDDFLLIQITFEQYIKQNEKKVPYHASIAKTRTWTDIALQSIISKAICEGYKKISFTDGKTQAKRWSTPGLEHYYDNVIPRRSRKLKQFYPKLIVNTKPLIFYVLDD